MGRIRGNRLLDILVKARTYRALDKAVDKSEIYQKALKQQNRAFDELDKIGLSKEQNIIVARALSAVNECGTAYGSVAYRLGLRDGIKLISELKEIE